MTQRSSLLQGTLDLLILKALSTGELHGLGVSRRIEQMTGGTFAVQPGSLFPALHRLEESGWLAVGVGGVGEQPPRQVLQADESGEATARRGGRTVEPHRARDGQSPRGVGSPTRERSRPSHQPVSGT